MRHKEIVLDATESLTLSEGDEVSSYLGSTTYVRDSFEESRPSSITT